MLDNDILVAAVALAGALQKQRLLLATAESCTGGGIAQTLTSLSGACLLYTSPSPRD